MFKDHLRIQKWFQNQIFLLMIFNMYIEIEKNWVYNSYQNKNSFIICIGNIKINLKNQ